MLRSHIIICFAVTIMHVPDALTSNIIGAVDSYLIMISAIWPDTSYYLLGQYYLIQEVRPAGILKPCHLIDLVLSDFEALESLLNRTGGIMCSTVRPCTCSCTTHAPCPCTAPYSRLRVTRLSPGRWCWLEI